MRYECDKCSRGLLILNRNAVGETCPCGGRMVLPIESVPAEDKDWADISLEIRKTKERIILMEQYLTMKVGERGFHGVADAAMDLRDLESYLKGLEFLTQSSLLRSAGSMA